MKNNIGALDRSVRFGLGGVLVAVGVASLAGLLGVGSAVAAAAALIGVVLVATASIRLCPIYRLVGADTCSAN